MADLVGGRDIRSPTAQGRFYKLNGHGHSSNFFSNRCGMKNIPQNFLPLPEKHNGNGYFDGQPNAENRVIVPILDWNNGNINWKEPENYELSVAGKDMAVYRWIIGNEQQSQTVELRKRCD